MVVVGTLDTKEPEVAFLRECLQGLGCKTKVVDVGLLSPPCIPADVCREEVCARANASIEALLSGTEGKLEAMTCMVRGVISLVGDWMALGEMAGIIALGGGVGTWIGTTIMRSLPLGLPKVMVSTVPFDMRPHIGTKDIVLIPSVADILGLNPMLRTVLRNAAAALAGMVKQPVKHEVSKPVVGMTGMGVTTPAILSSRRILEDKGLEVTTFHATGLGGSAFEECIQTDMFSGVLDLTTHEITNLVFKGVAMPSTNRLETAGKKGIPQVVGPGGLDFISRGPIEKLHDEDLKRPHYRHSPYFTHVRVSREGMRKVAEVVAEKINPGCGLTAVVIPLKGFSDQSRPGGPIHDPEADLEFTLALKRRLNKHIRLVEVDANINDESYAACACSCLDQIMKIDRI